jgi:hypothetical protein
VRAWAAFALLACYLSASEWSHCQRDTWMLLPALAALLVRGRRLTTPSARLGVAALGATLEGMLWGLAFWVKPHVLVPALACWLAGLPWLRRGRGGWRAVAADTLGVSAGGVLVLAAGVGWLWWSGAWQPFLDVFLRWNPEYYQHVASRWDLTNLRLFLRWLWPWLLIHVLAVPLAVVQLVRGCRASPAPPESASGAGTIRPALLAAFYLGWAGQAWFLQAPFEYIHLPAVLLGIAVVTSASFTSRPAVLRFAIPAFCLGSVALFSPLANPHRLAVWGRCWTEGSSARVRDRLSVKKHVAWEDFERIADHLRSLDVKDGELTCYTAELCPLWLELNLRPSTRFVYLQNALLIFPSHQADIYRELGRSRQRYIVTAVSGLPPTAAEGSGQELPALPAALRAKYPWSQPVIYRAGPYLVHRVVDPPPEPAGL